MLKLLSLVVVFFAFTFLFVESAITAEENESTKGPMVVLLFSKTCHAYCEKIRPVLQELRQQYPKITFCELDTSQETLKETKAKAKELGKGVYQFLATTADNVPYVGFFACNGRCVKELNGPKTKEIYVNAIESTLLHQK